MRTTTNTEEVKLSEKERKVNNSNLSRMAEVASGVHKKGSVSPLNPSPEPSYFSKFFLMVSRVCILYIVQQLS